MFRLAAQLESFLGVALAVVYSLSMAGGGVFAVTLFYQKHGAEKDLSILILTALFVCTAEVFTAFELVRRMLRPESTGILAIALNQRFWRKSVQPGLVVWWVWHFVAMAGTPDFFLEEMQRLPPHWYGQLGVYLLRLTVLLAASAAAHVFLLLAVDACWRHEHIVRRVHENRGAIHLLTAAILLALPNDSLLIFQVPLVFLSRAVLPHLH